MTICLSKTAFWDIDFDTLDEERNADFIICRVFQYGNVSDLRAVIAFYSPAQIRHAIDHSRGMDKHALALAELFAA